jgi:hypothetical protein
MPLRPKWTYGMQKTILERNETKMFQNYLEVFFFIFFFYFFFIKQNPFLHIIASLQEIWKRKIELFRT